MLPAAILALLAILPSSMSTYVNCNIACRKCKDRSMSPSVREIYCAMCKECRVRLRERALRAYGRNLMDDGIIDVDGLEPDKPGIRFEDVGNVNKDDAIINMEDNLDNLEHIDELPDEGADDGFMENTDAVKVDPDDKLIIANDITQPMTEETSTKPSLKPKMRQYRTKRVATTQANPLDNLFGNSLETRTENAQDDIFGDDPKKVKTYPLNIPDGCPKPPLCSDTEEDDDTEPSYPPTAPPTPPTTTTTLPPTTCPPVAACKPKRKRTTTPPSNTIPCMPCMPWCPATCNSQNLTEWNPWSWHWPPNLNRPLGPNGQNGPPKGSLSPNDSWQFSSEPPLFPESPDSTTTPSTTTPVPKTCWPLQMTCGPAQPYTAESATMNLPVNTQTPTTPQDFIYVYVGVPKELEKKK